MTTISASVGNGGVDRPDDVRIVQTLLARHADWFPPLPAPAATGTADEAMLPRSPPFKRTPARS